MNIGFDLDEVVAKTAGMAVDHFNEVFKTNYDIELFKSFEFSENIYFVDENTQQLAIDTLVWAVKDEEMMSSVVPYPEAVKVINNLKKQGHSIFIITKRQRELTESTNKWLHKHNIKFDKLICTGLESKGYLAKKFKLDCFVDDVIDNLHDMYNSKQRWKKGLILMTRPWNKDHYIDTSKFIRAENWDVILKIISIGNRLK